MQKKIGNFISKNIKYKKNQIIIATLIALSLLSFIIIFGRYLTSNVSNFFVRSKEFYFFSDKLSEDNSVYQVDNWSGVDDYTITINMNSRLNNIESATYDIGYDISYTCSDNAICQLSKTQGIIKADTNSDFFNLTITPNTQLKDGDKVVVDVVVNSTAPYKKTLKGRFTFVVGKEELTYQITDKSQDPYMLLSITNTLTYYTIKEAFDSFHVGDRIDIDTYLSLSEDKKAKCYSAEVKIEFNPREVLFDVTNSVYSDATNVTTTNIDGKTYINGFTIKIDAISSREIRFYKVDVNKDYTYPNSNNDKSIITVSSE